MSRFTHSLLSVLIFSTLWAAYPAFLNFLLLTSNPMAQ